VGRFGLPTNYRRMAGARTGESRIGRVVH
jgi:hypothetical protein